MRSLGNATGKNQTPVMQDRTREGQGIQLKETGPRLTKGDKMSIQKGNNI